MKSEHWGGLASGLAAVAMITAPLIYLTGNIRDAIGVISYDLADFLYGPLLSFGMILSVYVIREKIGRSAFRRMDLALLSAVLSAAGMAAVAFLRASNRHYHLANPDLHLENSSLVLTTWTTLIAGVNSLGFHFLGWMFLLLGSSNWDSRLFPRMLSGFYLLAGIASLFVYLFAELEGMAVILAVISFTWQGIFLWFQKSRKAATEIQI